MEKKNEVRKGAVIPMTGISREGRGGEDKIEAAQMVILTGYVKVN